MLKAHTCLCPKKFLFICETPCHFHTAGKKLLTLDNCGLKINDQEGVLINTTMCFSKRIHMYIEKVNMIFRSVSKHICFSSKHLVSVSHTSTLHPLLNGNRDKHFKFKEKNHRSKSTINTVPTQTIDNTISKYFSQRRGVPCC